MMTLSGSHLHRLSDSTAGNYRNITQAMNIILAGGNIEEAGNIIEVLDITVGDEIRQQHSSRPPWWDIRGTEGLQ